MIILFIWERMRNCGASSSSLANHQQRVAIICSPPPLDVTRRTQGTRNSKELQKLGRASSSWCLLSFAVKNPQIHNNHGCTTTINWFRRTCNESKITLYYWLHSMIIMQFTDLLITHLFSFILFSFLLKPACFNGHKNPPNKCAKIIRQNDPPE